VDGFKQLRDSLPQAKLRRYCWHDGERGPMSARFGFVRVRIPQDPRQELLGLVLGCTPESTAFST
jgi:hypothetical protein